MTCMLPNIGDVLYDDGADREGVTGDGADHEGFSGDGAHATAGSPPAQAE